MDAVHILQASTRESIMPMLQLTQDEKPIVWRPFKCPRGQALEGLGKRPGGSGQKGCTLHNIRTPKIFQKMVILKISFFGWVVHSKIDNDGPEFPLSASNSFEIAGQTKTKEPPIDMGLSESRIPHI